jgi:hypothetical protein
MTRYAVSYPRDKTGPPGLESTKASSDLIKRHQFANEQIKQITV